MVPPFYLYQSENELNSGDQLNSASDKTEKFVSEPPSPCKLPIARSLSFSPEKVNTVDFFSSRPLVYDSVRLLDSNSFQSTKNWNPLLSYCSTGISTPYLSKQEEHNKGKKTLILDLDETLIHSSYEPQEHFDFHLVIQLDNRPQLVYVTLRPGLFHFLQAMSKLYEIIIFTASVHNYADQIIDTIDPSGWISSRLYRNHCTLHNNVLVKDLSLLGRDLSSVVIVDNSVLNFQLQPKNGIECTPFFDDNTDCELSLLESFLVYLSKKQDVRKYTCLWEGTRPLFQVSPKL